MDLDRQSIERRDFPIARRGYDPATVDGHLRALADEVAELQRLVLSGGAPQQAASPQPTLSSAAGAQVRSILEAAEAAAAEIQSQAQESARILTEEAGSDARQTREDAIRRAESHVGAVSTGAERLLGDVEMIDGEIGVLVNGVREAAGRLVGELGSVKADMAALYDAAAGRGVPDSEPGGDPSSVSGGDPDVGATPTGGAGEASEGKTVANDVPEAQATQPAQAALLTHVVPLPEHEVEGPPIEGSRPAVDPGEPVAEGPANGSGEVERSGDLDGARLVVLNMALNGDPREEADRYLAEHFQIADRQQLLSEVYAAIEG